MNILLESSNILAIEPCKKIGFFRKKYKRKTKIIPVALSNEIGEGELHIDNYGGFTNSLKKNLLILKYFIEQKSTFPLLNIKKPL